VVDVDRGAGFDEVVGCGLVDERGEALRCVVGSFAGARSGRQPPPSPQPRSTSATRAAALRAARALVIILL
jgi:hypothetical protein